MLQHSPAMTLSRRRGTSLVEIMVVFVGLGFVLLVGTTMLASMLKLGNRSTADLDRLFALQALADQFRLDVAQADEAPAQWLAWKADATCLILRQGADHHIVYRWSNESLERTVVTRAKTIAQPLPVGEACLGVEFERVEGGLVNMRLRERHYHQGPSTAWAIAAALGGDRR